MRNAKYFIMSAFTLLVIGGCKKIDDDASQKSLDNFVVDDIKKNQNYCGFSPADIDPAKTDESLVVRRESEMAYLMEKFDGVRLKNSLAAALMSVPRLYRDLFFNMAGGRIKQITSSDLKTYCAENGALDEGQGIPGCMGEYQGGKQTMYLVHDDKVSMFHHLNRMFSYYFTSKILPRLSDFLVAEGQQELSEDMSKLESYMEDFLNVFEKELKNIQATGKADVSVGIKKLADMDKKEAQHLVFAEATDSYYCSPATHGVFKTMFKESYDKFQPYEELLGSPFFKK